MNIFFFFSKYKFGWLESRVACAQKVNFGCVFSRSAEHKPPLQRPFILFGRTICFMCVAVRFITPKYNIMSSGTRCAAFSMFVSFVRIRSYAISGVLLEKHFLATLQTRIGRLPSIVTTSENDGRERIVHQAGRCCIFYLQPMMAWLLSSN